MSAYVPKILAYQGISRKLVSPLALILRNAAADRLFFLVQSSLM